MGCLPGPVSHSCPARRGARLRDPACLVRARLQPSRPKSPSSRAGHRHEAWRPRARTMSPSSRRCPGSGPTPRVPSPRPPSAAPSGAVDTNVRRVLTRVVGRDLSARELQARADELVDGVDPASWTHAVMDLGALVCRPRRPDCGSCPISRWCVSAGMAERPEATARPRGLPFERTSRWLRGRIVARLRDLEDGAWARMPEVIGSHGPDGIAMAVAALRQRRPPRGAG